MILYDNYRVKEQFLSALGVGPKGWIFNSGVIFLGNASLFFFPLVYNKFKYNNHRLFRYILIFGEISGLMLLGIGFFVSGGKTSDIHNFFAIWYFVLLIPFSILLTFGIIKSELNNKLIIISIFLLFADITGLFIPFVNQYIFQKIIVYSYITFLFLLSLDIKRLE